MYDTATGEARGPRQGDTEEGALACRPGASARGPIRELAKFYEMMWRCGGVAGSGARVLLPQTVEAMTARHRVGMMDQTFKHFIDWGLGFIIDSKHYGQETLPYGYGPHASGRTFGHSGNQSSCAFCDPEHGLVVAWAVNGMPGEKGHQERAEQMNAAIYQDLQLDVH
jgi:CubicO group peptidase (beta-lactamase class C family)